MKHFVIIFFCFFVSLSVNGLAQKYYTLPEIKEQVKEGWHETCADKYGRKYKSMLMLMCSVNRWHH